MTTPAQKPKTMIQDNTRCIGCRACMVACKSWNNRPADHTEFFAGPGYQNPVDLDANNYTLITFNEIVTGAQPDWVFGTTNTSHGCVGLRLEDARFLWSFVGSDARVVIEP